MARYSIVIPVYNETRRIPKNIGKIFDFFGKFDPTAELIFVNDGSSDNTLAVLESFRSRLDFKIVSYSKNRGKGYAVRQGALSATGQWVVFFDVDLATPLAEFYKLPPLLSGPDRLIIGSRQLAGSVIEKSESFGRSFLGKGFTLLSRIFVPEVVDFTCGFKAIERRAAVEIMRLAKINRWAFDTEILFVARRLGFTIKQIPINWAHDDDSRVRVLKDVLSSAKELLAIGFYFLTGRYRKVKDS
jgi:glycosyltransferase involved in cell wall biosynthesis